MIISQRLSLVADTTGFTSIQSSHAPDHTHRKRHARPWNSPRSPSNTGFKGTRVSLVTQGSCLVSAPSHDFRRARLQSRCAHDGAQ
jgi:hypothetical protein